MWIKILIFLKNLFKNRKNNTIGRASAFSKDGNLKFAFKKFMRLIVPLFFATFTVVVPTAYFSRGYRDNRCGDPAVGSFFGFYASYCRNFFTDFRKCGFWWLWFLPVLFVVSVYNQPFCKWFLLFCVWIFCVFYLSFCLFFVCFFICFLSYINST